MKTPDRLPNGTHERGGICRRRLRIRRVLKAPVLVADLDNVAGMREAVEQGCGHLGFAKDAGSLPEGEVGRVDDRGAFVEAADQMEQELCPPVCANGR
jgi:hypothetical protein